MNEDIGINVSRGFFDPNRIRVSAYPKAHEDKWYEYNYDVFFEEPGILYHWFGIGDSLEIKIKKATCEAIEKLREGETKTRINSEEYEKLNAIANDWKGRC